MYWAQIRGALIPACNRQMDRHSVRQWHLSYSCNVACMHTLLCWRDI